ncbi:MAG: transporter substrate-binding domain-containing protein [Christensenellales bacterium]|nr:transporter substrate-binding domain-containing protein [Christensenellales bacterium]
MKKVLLVLLGLALIMTGTWGCAEENGVLRVGTLNATWSYDSYLEHFEKYHSGGDQNIPAEYIRYDSLSSLLLALESGNIQLAGVSLCTARYIAEHNDRFDYAVANVAEGNAQNFHMLTLEENQEIFNLLNDAIIEMKQDGTLELLKEKYIDHFDESSAQTITLPRFEDGQTVRVAVTGDIPPMDYVSADMMGAGFNIALLSEIASRKNVNFELVTVDTTARFLALSTQRVDAVFWCVDLMCEEHDVVWNENTEGMLLTEAYFSDVVARLWKK